MIIATAGHVDHGKTELVKALTGIDTDRLPEEKARGLSIDLGFAYQSLPGNTTLGFVDVPGHEKFIRNMLAGVGGIDLGLLVVAADDGVMPQTREHFAILDLLGIEQCVVAISKIDRVDDDRVHEVQDQIKNLLGETDRRNVAVYPVCAPDYDGIEALKNALWGYAQSIGRPRGEGHFRLAIDRVFSLKGVGLVVTGMAFSGSAAIDDRLLLSADGSEVRVRGIRVQDEVSDLARAGDRCAINISGRGVSENSIKRGDWLLHSNLYAPTNRIDVDLRVLDTETRPIKHWTPAHLHIGADHLPARVAVLEGGSIAAGTGGLAQLVLPREVFALHGDRFVLRDQSAQRTMAGGQVIDPFSPKRGRSRPSRIEMLQALNQRDSETALADAARLSDTGVRAEPFGIAHNLPPASMDRLVDVRSLLRVSDRIFSREQWNSLLVRTEQAVGDYHASNPTQPGVGCNQLQSWLRPYTEVAVLQLALAQLVRDKRLGQRGASWHLPSHESRIIDQDRKLWAQVTAYLAPERGSPMSLQQAADAIGVDKKNLEKSLKNATKIGVMVQISNNRYLPSSHLAKLETAVIELAGQTDDGFTAAEYCKYIETGRNFAIDLLEFFDRVGLTRRDGNLRQLR